MEGVKLSPEQQNVRALQDAGCENTVAQTCFDLDSGADCTAIQTRLTALVEKSEILATAIEKVPGLREPLQVFRDGIGCQIRSHVVANEESARESLLAEFRASLDVGLSPWRIDVVNSGSRQELVFSSHILILDIHSMQLIANHVLGLSNVQIDEEDLQFADISDWQNELVDSSETGQPGAKWGGWLSEFRAAADPDVGLARRKTVGCADRATQAVSLPVDDIRNPESSASAHSIIRAAWIAMLGRSANVDLVRLMIQSDGRDHPDFGEMLGPLCRRVPSVIAIDPGSNFSDMVAETDRQIESRVRIVDSMPTAEDAHLSARSATFGFVSHVLGANVLRPVYSPLPGCFIALRLLQSETTTSADILFDPNACTQQFAELLLQRFAHFLTSWRARPTDECREVSLLAESEDTVLETALRGEPLAVADETVLHVIRRNVESHPDRVAVVCDDDSLTYAEITDRATRIRMLLEQRAGNVGNVVIVGKRSAGFVAAILGTGTAGHAYVPVDSSYPEERINYIVEDCDAVAIISDGTFKGDFDTATPLIHIDHLGDVQDVGAAAPGDLPVATEPASIAYLIYTSGSTGQPKGVRISHANLLYSTQARLAEYDNPVDSYLMPSSFSFDSSVAGIFWTLMCGGKLVLPGFDQEADAQALGSLIRAHAVTHTLMLPSLYEAVLRTSHADALKSLHVAIVAGEECPESVVERHFDMLENTHIYNEYGPTEATVWCTVYEMLATDVGRLPIGHPIAGTSLYILDGNQQRLPVGAIGELFVASPGVADGYWQQEAQSRDKFFDDVTLSNNGHRLYKTGDLVRLNAKGELEFHGRVDRQVKIRGYRIELEEIESVLRKQPDVAAAVVTVQAVNSSKELVAYYTSDAKDALDSALLDAVKTELPEQYLPKAFHRLAEVPLMPNGKVDYAALPDVAADFAQQSTPYVAPRDKVEKEICSIFEDVIGPNQEIGRNDSFFDIGGHSILATIAVARLREKFAIEMPIRTLFDKPSIAELREALAADIGDNLSHHAENVTSSSMQGEISCRTNRQMGELSPMQAGIWYLSALEPDVPAYNLQCGFWLNGVVDVDALRTAINHVTNLHPALRSEIRVGEDGRPFAFVQDKVEVPFELLDEINERSEVVSFLESAATTPVAMDCAPLLRVSALPCGKEQLLLVLVFHHLVVEGWSVNTFLQRVSRAYEALTNDREIDVAAETIDYWDWNAQENERLQPHNLDRELKYWKEKLSGQAAPLDLPPRESPKSSRGGMVGSTLSIDVIAALEKIGRESGATLFVILLAAYQVLLRRYTGQSDIRVGTPINTRTRHELENTVGLFINTLVIRTQTDPDLTFNGLLARTRNDVLDAFSNMDAPLDMVRRALDEADDTSSDDLFQVMFALQNAPPVTLAIDGIDITSVGHDELHSGAGKVALSLVVEPGSDQYETWIEYDGDIVDQRRAEQFLGHFALLLDSVVASPNYEISNLRVLDDNEHDLVVNKFNKTTVDLDERSAIERIWEHVEQSPDSQAVWHEGSVLSYAQLGDSAQKVAAYLDENEVAKRSAIAICGGRRPELIAAMLGSHLAGCHYVPIDQDYPDERIRHILVDSGAALLITDAPQRFSELGVRLADLKSMIESTTVTDTLQRQWPEPDDLAYIVYTSGSTGLPKGVRIRQRGLSNLVSWEERTYSVTSRDRLTMIAGLGFDASVWEVWPCLALGAALYQIGEQNRSNPVDLYQWLADEKITISFLPTPLAEVVLDLPVPTNISLRYLFTGGDALHAREWPQLPYSVVNHYGPSENTVVATAGEVSSDLPANVAPHIGRPIDNTRCYVLDQNLSPLPQGVVGELCLAGLGVADGYQNQAEMTAKSFVQNPFATGNWSTLYRTGDRAYFKADGTIEFLGRIDDQVKIRGFRIELGDIESALSAHPEVAQAAVSVWTVNRDDRRIVAYLVAAEPGNEVDLISLRKHLRAALPSYMVPSSFNTLQALPQTSNGKLDRKALPAPSDDLGGPVSEPPITATEKQLAEIWQEILGIDSVSRHANYFDVGGNSISAMRVVSQISIELGVSLPLRAVVLDSLLQIAAFCDEVKGANVATKDGRFKRMIDSVLRK